MLVPHRADAWTVDGRGTIRQRLSRWSVVEHNEMRFSVWKHREPRQHQKREYTPYFEEKIMLNEGLKELYIDELKDIYNAENQLVKALPKIAKAASSEE